MNAVAVGLYSLLSGDNGAGGVDTLSTGGIHQGIAPEGTEPPFTIFNKQSNQVSYTFRSVIEDDMTWLVKGVAAETEDSDGISTARGISERANTILTDGNLSVTGKVVLSCRRVSDVEYDEVDIETGTKFWHAGSVYRIEVADA